MRPATPVKSMLVAEVRRDSSSPPGAFLCSDQVVEFER
jgi:hypothetical protein